MGVIPKWFRDWISSLLPKQKNTGAGAMQMGRVQAETVNNVTNVTNQFICVGRAPSEPKSGSGGASVEQRQVLSMIRTLPQRDGVLVFMEREFGTRMVIDLAPSQLLRVRRYVEAIQKRTTGEKR